MKIKHRTHYHTIVHYPAEDGTLEYVVEVDRRPFRVGFEAALSYRDESGGWTRPGVMQMVQKEVLPRCKGKARLWPPDAELRMIAGKIKGWRR